MMRQGILIQPSGEIIAKKFNITYPNINRELGVQWIEAISTQNNSFYLDEEGKLNGLARNIVAEALFVALGGYLAGDYLVGPVLILGAPDKEGDNTDIHPELTQVAFDIVARLQAENLLKED